MSIGRFNTAIQNARESYETGDQAAFVEAVDQAKRVIPQYPALVENLTQAQHCFPSDESLHIISLAALTMADFRAG